MQRPVQQPEIDFFTASDGYRIHFRRWKPTEQKYRATIVALHGIQSHSGWYAASSSALADAGYEVLFLDRRGSGLNEPARGDTPHTYRLLNDVAQFLSWKRYSLRRHDTAIPLVLMSVSWGGKLAALTAAQRPDLVDALALLYPGIRAKIAATAVQNLQLTTAGALGLRAKRVPIPLADPRLFTADPGRQEYIAHDPLTLREVTVSFLLANGQLDQLLLDAPESIHCPTLLMLAGQDRIVNNRETRSYFLRFASRKRKLIEYLEGEHTLEFERNRDEIVGDLLHWLDRVAKPAGR